MAATNEITGSDLPSSIETIALQRLGLPMEGLEIDTLARAGPPRQATTMLPDARQQNLRREAELFEPLDHATCVAGDR